MSIEFSIQLTRGAFALDATAKLPSRSITSVIGPSGSGKTSLLRCIAGLEKKAYGRIIFENELWMDSDTRILVPPHFRKAGYVFQHAALFPHLNVSQNIQYALKRIRREARFSLDELVSLCGLSALTQRDVSSLSGGERQRVALARTIAANARLLLLDEPLSSLDLEGREELLESIHAVIRETNIPALHVTHNIEDAARFATHAIVMKEGTVERFGPAEQILPYSFSDAEDRREPINILEAIVESHDYNYQITRLESVAGTLFLPYRNDRIGSKVRVSIWAREIGLSLATPECTSFLNIIAGKITSVEPFDTSRVLVTFDAGYAEMRALITRKSALDLELSPQTRIYAMIKSATLSR